MVPQLGILQCLPGIINEVYLLLFHLGHHQTATTAIQRQMQSEVIDQGGRATHMKEQLPNLHDLLMGNQKDLIDSEATETPNLMELPRMMLVQDGEHSNLQRAFPIVPMEVVSSQELRMLQRVKADKMLQGTLHQVGCQGRPVKF